jgi:Putative zinc-finger
MPGEINDGTPALPEEHGRGAQTQCSEFESLLMEALDGELSDERQAGFDAHRRTCALCGPIFADAEAGRMWLRSLEPVEPPAYLVHNILAATTGVVGRGLARAGAGGTRPLGTRARTWWQSWFGPLEAFVRQPRFVMSFGMIFFTFSLVVSTVGVKPADVAKIDLRPAALRHAYNDAQIKVIHYYDNIRFVYEIESKVRELKRATTPPEPTPAEKKENRNDNTSGQPDQRQDRNYSWEGSEPVLASLPDILGQPLQAASSERQAASEHDLAVILLPIARSSEPSLKIRLSGDSKELEGRNYQPGVGVTTNGRWA